MPAIHEQKLVDGLGYRSKIGVLVPATNTIAQPEYEALKPYGVTNHVARMEPSKRGSTIGDMDAYQRSLAQGPEHIKAAIDQIVPCEPDAIVLGHSIDTFRGGVNGANSLQSDLESHASGVPVILPSISFLAALETLDVGKKIGLLTPYWPPGDAQVESFFRDAGFEITQTIGLSCPGPLAIAATPVNTVINALKELAKSKPDIIVQPGTNLPTLGLTEQVENWLGRPFLSCNAATFWHCLRSLGLNDKIPSYGSLFWNY